MEGALGNGRFPAEECPFDETVKLTTLVGRGADDLAHVDVVDVTQQEHGPEGLAEFAEREIQLALASSIGTESPKDGRGGDLAQLDRHRGPQHFVQMGFDQPSVDAVAAPSPCV